MVATLGKDGAMIYHKDKTGIESRRVPTPFTVTDIVDPTRAGDNFKAGFLVGYMKGRSIIECAQIGNELGAACVGQKGDILPEEITSGIKAKYDL